MWILKLDDVKRGGNGFIGHWPRLSYLINTLTYYYCGILITYRPGIMEFHFLEEWPCNSCVQQKVLCNLDCCVMPNVKASWHNFAVSVWNLFPFSVHILKWFFYDRNKVKVEVTWSWSIFFSHNRTENKFLD